MRVLRVVALVIGLVVAKGVSARDDWTWQDTVWEVSYTATLAMDWRQTEWGVRHGHTEEDPFAVAFIGRRPSTERLALGCLAGAAAHAVVSYMLPSRFRRTWQAVTLGLEVGAVGTNYTRVGFRF